MELDALRASLVVLVVKNPPANAGDLKDAGSVPGSGRSPGGEHGNPLLYSCLENPMDRGAWWASVHGVAESDMTEQLSTHICAHTDMRAHIVAQLVKNRPAVQETRVRSLGWEDPWKKEKATHSSILAWRIHKESNRTERLSL